MPPDAVLTITVTIFTVMSESAYAPLILVAEFDLVLIPAIWARTLPIAIEKFARRHGSRQSYLAAHWHWRSLAMT